MEGAVANVEHLEQIQLVRERTKILVSFGDCAVTGNVTAMRNAFGVEDVLNRSYRENSAMVVGIPGGGNAWCRRCSTACARCTKWSRWTTTCKAARRRPTTSTQLVMDLLDGREPRTDGRRFG